MVCGGSNHNGQIGIEGTKLDSYGETEKFDDLFEYIEPFTDINFPEPYNDIEIQFIACGARSTAAISIKNQLFVWGTITANHMYSIPTAYVQ